MHTKSTAKIVPRMVSFFFIVFASCTQNAITMKGRYSLLELQDFSG
jgi:hypothetical protein